MKKVIIVIVTSIFSFIATNAQNDSIKYVNFRLPSNATIIYESNLNLDDERDETISRYHLIVRIDNFDLGINNVRRRCFPSNFLEKKKESSYNYLNQRAGLIDKLQYTSRIEKINDIKVLIIQKKHDNYFDYHVSIMNESNTMWFTALITYANESDKAVATQLMYDFLNSIVFDDPQNVPCSIITPDPFRPDEVCRDCDCLEDCDSLNKTFLQKVH